MTMNYKDARNQGHHRVPGVPIRVLPALQRQFRQVMEEGPSAVFRKLRILLRVLPDLPGAVLALPIVAFVRLVRPVVVIRFGPIRSANFGHFIAEPEVYLSKRDMGLDDSRTVDIQYYSNRFLGLPICNQQLKKMWDRTLRVNRLARWPDWINRSIPGGAKHMVPPGNTRDIYGCLNQTQTHLIFTEDEDRLGQKGLREMGIPEGVPFIGFHARDPMWLQELAPTMDFSYHNYRDSNIYNYMPAMEALTEQGSFAIRMGSVVECALDVSNERIIDYATNGARTEFLDLYLGAHCKFFVGSAAGITELPKVFRRPIVTVNQIPLEWTHSWSPNDLFIPKKLWLISEERFLSFREILDSGVGLGLQGDRYSEMGVESVENTPEEITAVVFEMNDRLQETWQTTREDEELQQRFWALLDNIKVQTRGGEPLHGVIASRIGAQFLRCNRALLD